MPRADSPTRAKPRKQPRQARSAATVHVILEAAARILESLGHQGFTTNAVAARAGVSIGSLYQYFPSKDALIGALIVQETSVLLADAAAALAERSGREAVLALIAAAVRHQLGRPALARLLDFEEARLPLDPETQRVTQRLRALLAQMLVRPDLPPQEDAAVAAADVLAIVKGMIDAAGERGELDAAGLRQRVARAVLGYLGADWPQDVAGAS
ncbi:MAG: TetR/AcrR family transcriptional regulator [Geminicoccaceae bacterium]